MPDHESNYKVEEQALQLLGEKLPGMVRPTLEQKKVLLSLLGVDHSFLQCFDAVRLRVAQFSDIKSAVDFDLLELKATNKELPEFPKGFFFGFTENEEMMLKVFQDKYFLVLVSLHPNSQRFELLNWKTLNSLIKHKRVQYQINLIAPDRKSRAAKATD